MLTSTCESLCQGNQFPFLYYAMKICTSSYLISTSHDASIPGLFTTLRTFDMNVAIMSDEMYDVLSSIVMINAHEMKTCSFNERFKH